MATHVPIDDILDNPFQPRQAFEAAGVQSLADEIKAEGFWNGTLQGRRNGNGKIELVFGHRRLRALRLNREPSVSVEILKLTDAQMALRALEENLQREGLTDLEKADAVKKAVEIARAQRRKDGKPEQGAVQEVADRLGLDQGWVSTLCRISMSMDIKDRKHIEAGHITGKTALAAKEWGGEGYVATLARQGKAAAKGDSDVPKPTHMTVAAMKKVVAAAPEPIREKLKAAIVDGEVSTPTEAAQKGRRLASERARRNKLPPPDLKAVICDWTDRIKDLEKQMREVQPYMDYVEEVPVIAERFRTALKQLIETARKLL